MFREAIDLSRKAISNKELIKRLIKKLCEEYNEVDWWTLFKKVSHKRTVLKYIKSVFEDIALAHVRQIVDNARENNIKDNREFLSYSRAMLKSIAPDLRALEPLDGQEEKSAEAQIALDKLGEELLRESRKYYAIAKYENEQSVLPTMQIVKHALSFASNSETVDDINKYLKELQEDARQLPPKEVSQEVKVIKQEIRSYCQKPDKIRWSLTLVRNCVPSLLAIKKTLGKDNNYYILISTKVADNAIYNIDPEVDFSEKTKNRGQESHNEYINVLKQAWKLLLDINKLDISDEFKNGKLNDNEENIRKRLQNEHVFYDDVQADISLETEDDAYLRCNDYKSLVEFCRLYPDSAHFREAMSRAWKIEDDAYPSVVSAKALLRYKELYPHSHNDNKVQDALIKLLFNSYGTISDYRTFLRLYPGHPNTTEAYQRIDYLSFQRCKTMNDYQQYLKDFQNGNHRRQAEQRIDDLAFALCKNATDYNQYIINYPNGAHSQEALSKIEESVYNSACQSNDYGLYLKRYPNGKYASQIRSKIDFQTYSKCKSISDYRDYLKNYSNGQYAELAKKAIQKKQRQPWYAVGAVVAFVLLGWFIYYVNNQPTSHVETSTTTTPSAVSSPVAEEETASSYSEPTTTQSTETYEEPEPTEEDIYGENQLETGAKPYRSYFGKARTGQNYLTFKTSGYCDYVVIVKRASNNKCVNHVYIRGGDRATLYLPDGTFIIYFYSGKGWNPNKANGNLTGGFVSSESSQKDGPIDLYSSYGEYTLYPVQNGNLTLQSANPNEMFN